MFNDLREFIKRAEELGEYRLIEGADWDREIGALSELHLTISNSPLLLFDKIKGYQPGYRVASNLATTDRRIALALGLPLELRGIELARAARDKVRERGAVRIPPVELKKGPVKENVSVGDQVDVFKFPAPRWHELDEGRAIGTGCLVITRDPDEGWVNLAPQRVRIYEDDKSAVTISMSSGRHNDLIRKKYWAKGQNCPVAIAFGQEPMLWAIASLRSPWGVSEYDVAGGWRGEPVAVTKGVTTDLPIPATAEIVFEGEITQETRIEGSFGDWQGYYLPPRPKELVKINSILHRNNPIIQGNPPYVLPSVWTIGGQILKSAFLWDHLDKQCPGVRGVWFMGEAGLYSMAVISIKQVYGGHAKQAAMAAAGFYNAAYMLRYVIVVDEDIDPSNLSEVLWALGTRTDPETSIDIVRGCWALPRDPMIPYEKRSRGQSEHSMAIIIACKPYYMIADKDFPAAIRTSPEKLQETKEKWSHLFKE